MVVRREGPDASASPSPLFQRSPDSRNLPQPSVEVSLVEDLAQITYRCR